MSEMQEHVTYQPPESGLICNLNFMMTWITCNYQMMWNKGRRYEKAFITPQKAYAQNDMVKRRKLKELTALRKQLGNQSLHCIKMNITPQRSTDQKSYNNKKHASIIENKPHCIVLEPISNYSCNGEGYGAVIKPNPTITISFFKNITHNILSLLNGNRDIMSSNFFNSSDEFLHNSGMNLFFLLKRKERKKACCFCCILPLYTGYLFSYTLTLVTRYSTICCISQLSCLLYSFEERIISKCQSKKFLYTFRHKCPLLCVCVESNNCP